ncbi:hypothetical protein NDN08_004241 [Rhodosorus marinus]|uniref:Uncharacterized protein n=1 Tax=Rhodosorus marinus TaxID=101924 RepID=A0AAV8UM80_9RHOD|nr:hypothetical protein NDN08_004241 [Rhodosorus marinus]
MEGKMKRFSVFFLLVLAMIGTATADWEDCSMDPRKDEFQYIDICRNLVTKSGRKVLGEICTSTVPTRDEGNCMRFTFTAADGNELTRLWAAFRWTVSESLLWNKYKDVEKMKEKNGFTGTVTKSSMKACPEVLYGNDSCCTRFPDFAAAAVVTDLDTGKRIRAYMAPDADDEYCSLTTRSDGNPLTICTFMITGCSGCLDSEFECRTEEGLCRNPYDQCGGVVLPGKDENGNCTCTECEVTSTQCISLNDSVYRTCSAVDQFALKHCDGYQAFTETYNGFCVCECGDTQCIMSPNPYSPNMNYRCIDVGEVDQYCGDGKVIDRAST